MSEPEDHSSERKEILGFLTVIFIDNDQDHRAGGPTRLIVEQPKNLTEANDVEKPTT